MENVSTKRFNIFRLPSPIKAALCFTALFFALFIIYIILKPAYSVSGFSKGAIAQALTFTGVLAVVVFGVVRYVQKKLTPETVVILIFIVGMLIRIGYMLVTSANTRQYDTYVKENNGHEGYAYYIFENFALPDNNDYQFYHPPLNAIMQALFMRLTNGLTTLITKVFGSGDYFLENFNEGKPEWVTSARYYLYGTCQILSVVYSFLTMLVGYKILKTIGLKGYALVFWFAFFALFPRHVLFAATLNNDPIAYLFSLSAIYFALRWWLCGNKIFDVILCALCIGLGMNAKLSVAVVCLPIGCVFLYELIKTIFLGNGTLNVKRIILQYGVFAAICVPLSLAFVIYAKIRFNQPIGFVFNNLNKLLSTTHHSVFERLFITFDSDEFFASLYLRTFTNLRSGLYNNYNTYNFAVRSAIFGEFGFWHGESFAIVALLSLISLTFTFAGAVGIIVVNYVKKTVVLKTPVHPLAMDDGTKVFIFGVILFLSHIVSYVVFYIKMPYSCTMDFRYIMPVVISIPLMLSGFGKIAQTSGILKVYNYILITNVLLFLFSSALFYMTCV